MTIEINVEKLTAKIVHKTDLSDGKQQEITTFYDFSNVSQKQLLEMAIKNRVIATRSQWRDLTRDQVDGQTIKVAEQLASSRKPKSRIDTVKKLAPTMTQEELLNAIEEMKARLDA